MSAEQLWETTMDPDNRCLKQITLKDMEKAELTINNLMGKDVQPRKEILTQKGNTVELTI